MVVPRIDDTAFVGRGRLGVSDSCRERPQPPRDRVIRLGRWRARVAHRRASRRGIALTLILALGDLPPASCARGMRRPEARTRRGAPRRLTSTCSVLYLGDGCLAAMHSRGVHAAHGSRWTRATPGSFDECRRAVRGGAARTTGRHVQCTSTAGRARGGGHVLEAAGPCLFPQHGPGATSTSALIALTEWQAAGRGGVSRRGSAAPRVDPLGRVPVH